MCLLKTALPSKGITEIESLVLCIVLVMGQPSHPDPVCGLPLPFNPPSLHPLQLSNPHPPRLLEQILDSCYSNTFEVSDTELNDADVHVGGFGLDNCPDVVIASPEPLYLDYDSDIIPATLEPCSRVIVPTSRIPQQAHVPSEQIPSQLNFLVYSSERYDVAHHCCSCGR
ncbi:hypothetical protein J6590_056072 [Homalodisca vitripennis]|nr:hypothetical protein J6590_056072 [Homalodisca vitripennis]